MVGTPYSYDFKSASTLSLTGEAAPAPTAVSWSMISGALPNGLTLDAATGVVSGTPVAINETGADFEILASYLTASGQRVYTIVVGEAVLQVTDITVGNNHSCAVTTAGGAKCWGYDMYGQLGDGGGNVNKSSPVDVFGLTSGVAKISAGGFHTCAVTVSGGLKCWGRGDIGQIGDGGQLTDKTVPVDVMGLTSGVASVSMGGSNTCALTTAGGVKCWGGDGYGQLGDGGDHTYRNSPVDVWGLTTGVKGVATGGAHSCALTVAGAVKCWGYDNWGQVGDGGTNMHTIDVPVDVVGLSSGVASVAAGGTFTCAVMATGSAKCWGWDNYGQVGDGGANTGSATPVDVVGLSGIVQMELGDSHTCAVTNTGGLKCWGWDGNGQLGDGGANTNQGLPVDVQGLTSNVSAVSAGQYHTCAIMTNGNTKCWGHDGQGQLGNGGTNVDVGTPVSVLPY